MKNYFLRILVQKIFEDARNAIYAHSAAVERSEILSFYSYLRNILFGGKLLSRLEMVRGYSPSIDGLTQKQLKNEMVNAHQDQVSRRAVNMLSRSYKSRIIGPKEFMKGERVYF